MKILILKVRTTWKIEKKDITNFCPLYENIHVKGKNQLQLLEKTSKKSQSEFFLQ